MINTKEIYMKRKSAYDKLFQRQKKVSNQYSNLRLLIIAAGIAISLFLYITRNYILLIFSVVATLVSFIYFVARHDKLTKNMIYSTLLSKINDDCIMRGNGEWDQFADNGKEFIDENHSFSNDLDIFGSDSLFQLINTARTYYGRHTLNNLLTQFPTDVNDIYKRQKAIGELAIKLSWRQRFLAEGIITSDCMNNPEELISWVGNENSLFRKAWTNLITKLLPVITLTLLLIFFSTGSIPYFIPVIAIFIQFILLFVKRKEREVNFQLAKKYKRDIEVYYHMIKHIEKHKFCNDHLNELKSSMRNNVNISASQQVDELFKIVESLDNRNNAFYFIFNLLTLWDFKNMIALEKWKENSGSLLKRWLEVIGYVEALSSLSILKYDNPEWTMPEFSINKDCIFDAKSLGHPLLTGNRVNNDLQFHDSIHALLITGSNMSGKSTLLRAAGINLVLAYAGAPVCAEFFRTSLMKINTCMRVSDNLGKNISSFYAELLRIKTIVQEATKGEKVFYLLDEIFKGTNSKDRHLGAKVLIQKLCTTNSIGLVSTHDLELCDLENKNNSIKNYHFREYYKNNEIYFDYKLRSGASTTRNAIYLMKLAGIDIEENKIYS